MKKILIAGGSGFIGKTLTHVLLQKGYQVAHLSRKTNKTNPVKSFYWNIDSNVLDEEAVAWADVIVYLAGVNVADKRWTEARKQEIVTSRVGGINLILQSISKLNKKLDCFVSASAVGYYGATTSQHIFDENDARGSDFLADTCYFWELAVDKVKAKGIRIAQLRTPIVLGKKGGALPKLVTLVKLGLGSAIGNGNQYVPWIHLDDLCMAYVKIIESPDLEGVFNVVSPQHITNKELMKTIASKLRRPLFLPNIPEWVLSIFLGERSVILTEGSRVSSLKLVNKGFEFKYPTLIEAIKNLL